MKLSHLFHVVFYLIKSKKKSKIKEIQSKRKEKRKKVKQNKKESKKERNIK